MVWEGPHTPVVRVKPIARVAWRRLPNVEADGLLAAMVDAAGRVRRATYKVCNKCGRVTPPEWMHDRDLCQSCAATELGVVY